MSLLNNNKTVGIITIVSGFLALASIIAGCIGVQYHFEAFSDPTLILTLPVNTSVARWSMIFDMLGYYMLLLPVIYYLHEWMKDRTSWNNLVTFCGLAYVLIGAIGAAILAAVWPPIILAYPTASREMQEILKTNFEYFNRMVYDGMWNLLELFFAGTWWLFTGAILYKSKKKLIGILSILTGSFSLLDSCAGIFQLAQLHKMALNGYLILAIMWAVVLGAFLIKRPLPNIGQHEPDFSNNIPVIPAHDKA